MYVLPDYTIMKTNTYRHSFYLKNGIARSLVYYKIMIIYHEPHLAQKAGHVPVGLTHAPRVPYVRTEP